MLIDIEQSWPVDDELVVSIRATNSNTGSSVGEPSRWLLSYLHVVVTRSTLCNISLSHQTHEHETKAHWENKVSCANLRHWVVSGNQADGCR